VVTVLLAAAGIAPGGLDMAARVRVDPDISPGRRNDQSPDAPKVLRVADDRPIRAPEAPALAGAATADAGTAVRGVAQPSGAGRGDRVVSEIRDGRRRLDQSGFLNFMCEGWAG
jgi:hypothetical protein